MQKPVKTGIFFGIIAAVGTFVFNAVMSLFSILLALALFMFFMVLYLTYLAPTLG